MKSRGFFPLVVLLFLGTVAPWAVEGAGQAIKAGVCPSIKPAQCLIYEKPECQTDWQCLGKKKCCRDVCGIKCLDPVAIMNRAKKTGKCPVVLGQCMMLNPPNYCERDSQCQGDFKCCKGMCGKACVSPVKALHSLSPLERA
ncbi:LOW QUALITY PROTEIN: antileukoproteinase-like [Choloepus didactylus]|uniref:LOW QUALITY PROTEIN: antileukoproteinase-like n=1 Tax=Choloepus didactylus TaxID=27675 RepID=UPI00189EBCD9|nr:LOW QUALITY PROTEIN: antileukoproteinase-like [Choloepus didactylus]